MTDDINITSFIPGQPSSDISLFGDAAEALGLDTSTSDVVTEYSQSANADASQLAGQFASTAFGYSWAFDDELHDFVKVGNAPVRVTELDCFAEWVTNCLMTERKLYMVFDENFGIEYESVITGDVPVGTLQGYLKSEVQHALAVHNRFKSLNNFTAVKDGNVVNVAFNVVTTAGEVPIVASLGLANNTGMTG